MCCPDTGIYPGEAGRGVHGLQEAAPGHQEQDHRVLRAQIPGQVLRRGTHTRGTVRETQRGQ